MLILFYIVFILVILLFEFTRKKNFWFDFLSIFNLYFIIYYLFPAMFIKNSLFGYSSKWNVVTSTDNTFIETLILLISYIFVITSYQLSKGKNNKEQYEFINPDNRKKIIIFLILLGAFSLLVYSNLFGGFQNLISLTNSIRNNAIESENSSYEFIRRFIPGLLIASYLIYSKFLIEPKYKYVILSIIIAFPWFIVNAGRAAILNYILVLLLSYMFHNRKKVKVRLMILLTVCSFILINYLRPLFSSFIYLSDGFGTVLQNFVTTATSGKYQVENFKSIIHILVDSFSHKYQSVVASIEFVNNGTHSMNFFFEIIIGIISLIPSSILSFEKPESITWYNTYYLTGIFSNQVPPGGVAFGYYTLSWAGVIIFSVLIGFIGRKLNDYFYQFRNSSVIYVLVMFLWVSFYIDGDLRITLQRNFVLIIVLIFLNIFQIKNKEK